LFFVISPPSGRPTLRSPQWVLSSFSVFRQQHHLSFSWSPLSFFPASYGFSPNSNAPRVVVSLRLTLPSPFLFRCSFFLTALTPLTISFQSYVPIFPPLLIISFFFPFRLRETPPLFCRSLWKKVQFLHSGSSVALSRFWRLFPPRCLPSGPQSPFMPQHRFFS